MGEKMRCKEVAVPEFITAKASLTPSSDSHQNPHVPPPPGYSKRLRRVEVTDLVEYIETCTG